MFLKCSSAGPLQTWRATRWRDIRRLLCEWEESDGLPPMPSGIVSLLSDCFQRDPAKRPSDLKGIAGEIAAVYAMGNADQSDIPSCELHCGSRAARV